MKNEWGVTAWSFGVTGWNGLLFHKTSQNCWSFIHCIVMGALLHVAHTSNLRPAP